MVGCLWLTGQLVQNTVCTTSIVSASYWFTLLLREIEWEQTDWLANSPVTYMILWFSTWDFLCLLSSCWLLAWLALQQWIWRRYFSPECLLTFTRLQGIISQKDGTLHCYKVYKTLSVCVITVNVSHQSDKNAELCIPLFQITLPPVQWGTVCWVGSLTSGNHMKQYDLSGGSV
jgi:hypothetical protein